MKNNTLDLACPHCGQPLYVSSKEAGSEVTCGACQQPVLIPVQAAVPVPAQAPVQDKPARVIVTGLSLSVGELTEFFLKAWVAFLLASIVVSVFLFMLALLVLVFFEPHRP